MHPSSDTRDTFVYVLASAMSCAEGNIVLGDAASKLTQAQRATIASQHQQSLTAGRAGATVVMTSDVEGEVMRRSQWSSTSWYDLKKRMATAWHGVPGRFATTRYGDIWFG
jgi:phage tail sheath gpL-like